MEMDVDKELALLVIICVVALCITAIMIYALSIGHDGTLVTGTVAALAAIVTFLIKSWYDERKG